MSTSVVIGFCFELLKSFARFNTLLLTFIVMPMTLFKKMMKSFSKTAKNTFLDVGGLL